MRVLKFGGTPLDPLVRPLPEPHAPCPVFATPHLQG